MVTVTHLLFQTYVLCVQTDGFIEKERPCPKVMAEVYYGIAGNPVSHSISPLLVSIVAQHLEQNSRSKPQLEIKSLNLIEANSIQDALAWGYAKTIPNRGPNNSLSTRLCENSVNRKRSDKGRCELFAV